MDARPGRRTGATLSLRSGRRPGAAARARRLRRASAGHDGGVSHAILPADSRRARGLHGVALGGAMDRGGRDERGGSGAAIHAPAVAHAARDGEQHHEPSHGGELRVAGFRRGDERDGGRAARGSGSVLPRDDVRIPRSLPPRGREAGEALRDSPSHLVARCGGRPSRRGGERRQHSDDERERVSHVGYYLVGRGRAALDRALRYRPTLRAAHRAACEACTPRHSTSARSP